MGVGHFILYQRHGLNLIHNKEMRKEIGSRPKASIITCPTNRVGSIHEEEKREEREREIERERERERGTLLNVCRVYK